MTPEILALIFFAIEKGAPVAINTYNDIVDSIAVHKDLDADTKVELLARIAKMRPPERHFVKTPSVPADIMEGAGA